MGTPLRWMLGLLALLLVIAVGRLTLAALPSTTNPAAPADTDPVSQGASQIRALKQSLIDVLGFQNNAAIQGQAMGIATDGTVNFPTGVGVVATPVKLSGFLKQAAGGGTLTAQVGIATSDLRTSTGSLSGLCASVSLVVVMNDYMFFPGLSNTCTGAAPTVIGTNTGDPLDTVGRFTYSGAAGNGTMIARWRYITTSDAPTAWVCYDTATGQITATWVSDDPPPISGSPIAHADMTGRACVSVDPNSLGALGVKTADVVKARAWLGQKGYSEKHFGYRAFQQMTKDDAPAVWLMERTRMNLKTGQLTTQ